MIISNFIVVERRKMKIEQSEEELKKHLKEQIQLLIDSCKNYDNGNTFEAKSMAVRIRVLLYDNRFPSLLKQLDKKDILFYDTAYEPDPANIPTTGLASMQIGGGVKWIPHLDVFSHGRGKISFQEWWDQLVVIDTNNDKFSREDLIRTIADKDGGAHVDPELPSKYYNIASGDSLGWTDLNGNPIKDMNLASMRQISFEVLKSLKDEFPEYFS